MATAEKLTFGFTAAAAAGGDEQKSDAERYRQMMAKTHLGYELGYKTAWVLEHHFTDYYPTPSPMLLMSHLAAAFPGLSLGSCVIVAPWYNPLRLAEEIAMLSHFCTGELHLGFGRGTAKLEYDAYNIDMAEAKPRYAECMQILHKAFSGQPISHHGTYYNIEREVALRPTPNVDKLHFYGAVGSLESAAGNADMGLPVLCNSQFPPHALKKILAACRTRAAELNFTAKSPPPISANCLIADSDDEARDQARNYLSKFFALQADHYEADANHWKDIAGYEQFSKSFGNLRKLADPNNIDLILDFLLIGSPATVADRVAALRDMGFGHVIVNCAKEGIPAAVRHQTLSKFAAAVAPKFA